MKVKDDLVGGKDKPTIDDLIEFINNNPPDNAQTWFYSEWEKNLNSSIPNWISLIKDPKNWDRFENMSPCISENLCELFIDVVGVKLAKRFFRSTISGQKKASEEWLKNLNNLTQEVWQKLDNDMKEFVIYYVFKEYPGEPFETYNELIEIIGKYCNAYEYGKNQKINVMPPPFTIFPQMGYIPSPEISKLRSIIQRAGDKEFLKIVEKMISERKKALNFPLSLSKSLQFLYHPTRDERELIACAMDIFRKQGYQVAPLPEIYLSFETPPLFVAYPELEEEILYEKLEKYPENKRTTIPRNRERGKPETASIEELLGCYIPDHPKIVLYERGIRWFIQKYHIEKKYLRMIVLIHEIGHWITHLLPKPNVPIWPIELYKSASQEVHEGWAQLITYWTVNKAGFKDKFEELNRHQSYIYKVYEQFQNNNESSVVKSLEIIRKLSFPAKLEDWKRSIE